VKVIQHLVPEHGVDGRYSSEQSRKRLESAIRRRFVPRLFHRLIHRWIFAAARPICRNMVSDPAEPSKPLIAV
jgi:hypothetical protein